MVVSLSYCLVAALLGLYFVYKLLKRTVYKFPPGPKGLPVLGNLFEITPERAHIQYAELAEKHGDVISVNMAGKKVVILNSSEAIKEALVSEETRDAFAGRPYSFYVKHCDLGPSTSFIDFCDVWKLQRKFLTQKLKIFDGGKHTIEQTIKEELELISKKIQAFDGKPFNIQDIVMPALANILLILIAGQRYDFDDPALKAALRLEEVDTKLLSGHRITILTMFPFLRHLPGTWGNLYRDFIKARNDYLNYIFTPAKKSFDPSITRGFLDTMFSLQADNPWLKDDNIKGILRETMGAGLTTTRSSLMSFFLIILHRPDVMRNIQKEIDDVIGDQRSPSVFDRGQMPYTEAVTMELQRYLSVAPTALPHNTTRDVQFREYFLPKNTLVFYNVWAAHRNKKVWDDPCNFRPGRFLGQDGRLVSVDNPQRKSWIPFGVGRRACLGETFARSRIFLVITTLLQNFDFRPCEDEPLPSCDPRDFSVWITIHPPKFRLKALPRKETVMKL